MADDLIQLRQSELDDMLDAARVEAWRVGHSACECLCHGDIFTCPGCRSPYHNGTAPPRAEAGCPNCGHPPHGDGDCGEVVGYDHLNGDHECGCPGTEAGEDRG